MMLSIFAGSIIIKSGFSDGVRLLHLHCHLHSDISDGEKIVSGSRRCELSRMENVLLMIFITILLETMERKYFNCNSSHAYNKMSVRFMPTIGHHSKIVNKNVRRRRSRMLLHIWVFLARWKEGSVIIFKQPCSTTIWKTKKLHWKEFHICGWE